MQTDPSKVKHSHLPGSRWNSTKAREVLARLDESGLSAAAFARKHDVSIYQLYFWKSRLRGKNGLPSFLPVQVNEKTADPEPSCGNDYVELLFCGVTVRVVGRVSTAQVQETLRAVQELAC